MAKRAAPALSAETWLALYGGTSADGAGRGHYVGRTTDAEAARAHWLACKSDPYSIGMVVAFTESESRTMWQERDWEKFIPREWGK